LGIDSGARDGLKPGSPLPILVATSLKDGSAVDWHPASDKKTLLVFCALWHPQGRDLLKRARAWAAEHDTHLAAFSIDWGAEQARRYLTAAGGDRDLLYAGPGGVELAAQWKLRMPGQALLISADGKVLSCPVPLELP
jgi:hypothetical protein